MKLRFWNLWILAFGITAIAGVVNVYAARLHRVKLASPTVYIAIGEMGHGSGVHLGHGFVLTAGHVADNDKTLTITDTKGVEHKTETLWINKKYDVALLKMDNANVVASRDLSCRYLDRGEELTFEGNPLDLHYITTTGKVARSEIEETFDWAEANTVDAQLAPGMSGGPALDRMGYVVGVNVGITRGFALGIIVPGRTVCKLMAR